MGFDWPPIAIVPVALLSFELEIDRHGPCLMVRFCQRQRAFFNRRPCRSSRPSASCAVSVTTHAPPSSLISLVMVSGIVCPPVSIFAL